MRPALKLGVMIYKGRYNVKISSNVGINYAVEQIITLGGFNEGELINRIISHIAGLYNLTRKGFKLKSLESENEIKTIFTFSRKGKFNKVNKPAAYVVELEWLAD